MIKVVSSEEMRMCDLNTIRTKRISSLFLMERVGREAFDFIIGLSFKRVLVVCGGGGNGGDGYVIARYFYENGYDVSVMDIANHYTDECLAQKNLYLGSYAESFQNFDLVIDCIIGIGLKDTLREEIVELIGTINFLDAMRISIDIPTGLNSDNGLVMGSAIKADYTLVVQYYKYGNLLNDGLDYCGIMHILDIGIISDSKSYFSSLRMFKRAFPKKKANSHKGSFGFASLISGSKDLLGASIICYRGLSALRMGVGYANLVVPKSLANNYSLIVPECILSGMPDNDGLMVFDEHFLDTIIKRSTSITIGMGVGVTEEIYKIVCYLLKNYTGNLIIDADGLNALATYGIEALGDHAGSVIITPHIKEFSRLTKLDVNRIKEDSVSIAREFALEYNVGVVLKGTTTIVTDGETTVFSSFGTPALAKAGSGDLLSGIMAGIFAFCKESMLFQASLSCCIHGLAACMAAKRLNEYSVVASDIVNDIPYVIKDLKEL